LAFDFSDAHDPAKVRESFLNRVFGTIGIDNLVISEAGDFVRMFVSLDGAGRANPRPFQIFSTVETAPRFFWLKDEGVDVAAPSNAALLEQAAEVQRELGIAGQPPQSVDLVQGIDVLRDLQASAAEAELKEETPPAVIDVLTNAIARGCDRLSREIDGLRNDATALSALIELIDPLVLAVSPRVAADIEARHESSTHSTSGARVDGGQAAINLCQINSATAERFLPTLEELVRDPHPDVRLAIASSLGALWDTAREGMWRLAEYVARQEKNRRVLEAFCGFLTQAVHGDPRRIEELLFAILERIEVKDDRPGKELRECIGRLMVLLWVSHDSANARQVVARWLEDAENHDVEFGHAIVSIREGLILGYKGENPTDIAIRRRCQDFAAQLVETTATGLERYFACPAADRSDDGNRRAGVCARLLDAMGMQFYFSSGAFRDGQADEKQRLTSDRDKEQFLAENAKTFHRIGDAGPPHTIYNLIQMLDFLMPGNPKLAFDLVAHAVSTAGRNQGFQNEKLGGDRAVALIGRCLADYREIFADRNRCDRLIACLDAFVMAGWPAATRLLYQLPELLR
jgi:hypothetical protein